MTAATNVSYAFGLPNKRLVLMGRRASLRSARRPAAHPQSFGSQTRSGDAAAQGVASGEDPVTRLVPRLRHFSP